MAHGGKRAGSGRKKGSPTRKTSKTTALAEQAAGEGPLPLEVMLKVMRDHFVAQRFDAAASVAKDCAPYLHPKLNSTTISSPDGGPVRLEVEETIVRSRSEANPVPPLNGAGRLP
jgi:hypothetical protein